MKRQTLELYREVGFNETARRTGISKATLNRWLDDAGVDRAATNGRVTEQHQRAARAAAAKRTAEHEEARQEIAEKLLRTTEITVLRVQQLLAAGEFTPEHIGPLSQLLDKSVRNLELLSGRPTARITIDGEMQTMIIGMKWAFEQALAVIPVALHDAVTDTFGSALRQAQTLINEGRLTDDGEVLELEAGDVDESDTDAS